MPNINKDYVVDMLTTFKNDSPSLDWESITKELDKDTPNPCRHSDIQCGAVDCDDCIFEYEQSYPENLYKTLEILKQNPEIITIVSLLT